MRWCLAYVALLALPACSYDLGGFTVAARGDATADAADAVLADTMATTDTTAVDTTLPADDADAIAATCKAKGNSGTCLSCCGDNYPKGRSAVVKRAQSCLCGAPVCASQCNSTFCKPGAPKTPDAPCGDCLRGALDAACSSDAAAARADDPQVAPYLGCASQCR